MERREYLRTVGVAGVPLLAGCVGGVKAEKTSEVGWDSFEFNPKYIKVDTGTTVTWRNDESYNHTVTAASDNWSTDTVVPGGETTTHTFEADGVYVARCREHGSRMKIAVGDATIKNEIES